MTELIQQERIRIRGQIDIQSSDTPINTPREWYYYVEGTNTQVYVGEFDHIEINLMFVSESNGFTDIHFAAPDTELEDLELAHRIFRTKLATNTMLPFGDTNPCVGPVGYGVWGKNAGANAVEGTFWGWLYRG